MLGIPGLAALNLLDPQAPWPGLPTEDYQGWVLLLAITRAGGAICPWSAEHRPSVAVVVTLYCHLLSVHTALTNIVPTFCWFRHG
jgi:hypothetical protein